MANPRIRLLQLVAPLVALMLGAFAHSAIWAQEIQINTDTSGDQLAPVVAANATGSFVVAWQTARAPGSAVPTVIRARRYGPGGTALGNDFGVNSTTTGFHGAPAVAMATDGSFVVAWSVWTSFFEPDSFNIRARRFGSDGAPLGADFAVNTVVLGRQVDPVVAMLAGGGFVIAWQGPGTAAIDPNDADIQARRYNAGGTALGAEFRVNSATDGNQTETSVAALANGGFFVTWSGASTGTDQSFGSVQGRRFDAAGVAAGPDFQVNSFTTRRQSKSAVAAASDGAAWAVWQSDESAGNDNRLTSVHAQRYGTTGSAAGSELQVNTSIDGSQDEPAVTIGPGGDILVAWHSVVDPLAGDHQIRARLLTPAGSPSGNDFALNGSGAMLREHVGVAGLPGGDFVAVWSAKGGALDKAQIKARLLTGDCTPTPTTLCLGDGRFQVVSRWRTPAGATGDGNGVQLTRDTGYFWFFRDTNVEVVTKVLDACGVNNRYWVFSAGLTNVEVDLTITDLLTGEVADYHNPIGQAFPPILDTSALDICSSAISGEEAVLVEEDLASNSAESWLAGEPEPIASRGDDTFLLLNNNRYRISMVWETRAGATGPGHGIELTQDTGYFWFFNPNNVEVILKVLNACTLNQRYWVFVGGLTNVKVDITILDTLSGTTKVYSNQLGQNFQPIQDTNAFPTCP